MSKPKFQIGDVVWRAANKTRPVYYPCLECAGKGYLTVILGDDTQVTVECECCRRGYEGSHGDHQKYEYYDAVESGTVSGVEVSEGTYEYRVPADNGGHYCVQESDLFTDEASATVRAQELAVERTKEQAALLCLKHNKSRTWAWNVSYHRKAIRDAEKTILHHTEQLNYAKTREKEDK